MSNVNPNHYKVAGRERQGDAILQERHRQRFADNLARERFQSRQGPPVEPGNGPAEDSGASTAEVPRSEGTTPASAKPARKKPARKASKTTKTAKKTARPTAKKAGRKSPARTAKKAAKPARPAAKGRSAAAKSPRKGSKAPAAAKRGARRKRSS